MCLYPRIQKSWFLADVCVSEVNMSTVNSIRFPVYSEIKKSLLQSDLSLGNLIPVHVCLQLLVRIRNPYESATTFARPCYELWVLRLARNYADGRTSAKLRVPTTVYLYCLKVKSCFGIETVARN